MKKYYTIPLTTLLEVITKKQEEEYSFSINNHVVTITDIMPFIYDNDFLDKQNKSDYEQIIYNIVFTIHNPETIHNGSIVINENSDKQLFIVRGYEKILAALYHKEQDILISTDTENLFENIQSYRNVDEINYDFTKFVPIHYNENYKEFIEETFDIDYPAIYESSLFSLDETWNNKDYILKQVKNNNLNIKHLIPKEYLEDENFLLELIHTNYKILDDFYDFLSSDFHNMLVKTFYSLKDENFEKFSNYLGSVLHSYNHYFYEVEENYPDEKILENEPIKQSLIKRIVDNKELLLFIFKNPLLIKKYNTPLRKISGILPSDTLSQKEFMNSALSHFHHNVLYNIEHSFFNAPKKVALLFVTISNNWNEMKENEQEIIKDFFINYDYSHKSWNNDPKQVSVILNSYIKYKPNSNKLNSHPEIFKIIYNCLSDNLKNNVDFLYDFSLVYPPIFEMFLPNMQQEKKLIDNYLYNSNISKYYCPVKKDYFFTVKDPVLILKLVNTFENLLFESDCPKEWVNNVNYYKDYMIRFFEKFPQHIKNQICDDVDYVKSVIYYQYDIFKDLTSSLKSNKDVILIAAKARYFEFKEVPKHVWLNENFCFEVCKVNSHVLKYVPDKIKNSVSFIMNVFQFYSTKKLSHIESLDYEQNVKLAFPEIRKLLGHHAREHDCSDFLYDYFTKQKKYHMYQRLDKKSIYLKNNKHTIHKI